MKKVRFETPTKFLLETMQEHECHSPRPFIERQTLHIGNDITQIKPVVFSNDPVQRFENDNSSPYPMANKTYLNGFRKLENYKSPSSDLDLSMLDCSQQESRTVSPPEINNVLRTEQNAISSINPMRCDVQSLASQKVLTSIENKIPAIRPSDMIGTHNDFFIRKENIRNMPLGPLYSQLNQFSMTKENNPVIEKHEMMRLGSINTISEKENNEPRIMDIDSHCKCHHCIKIMNHNNMKEDKTSSIGHRHNVKSNTKHCTMTPNNCVCNCNRHIVQPTCHCNNLQQTPLSPQNTLDKKTWAIEKYEKSRHADSTEVEKPNVVFKEKREPTVSDLFKIIKLQNEQLQLLQEKVDKFISTHNRDVQEAQTLPIHNYVTEQLAVQTMNSEQHKISIGVMTSFEMVRTSTVINKEIVKQCEAQIQCNRSQISIKEVVSKKQTGNLNFLDGISPVSKDVDPIKKFAQNCFNQNGEVNSLVHNMNDDKTLNELSLYNVQVDNATTPLMSPEQSLYLDVRDYSESDSGSDDQSNVGWTYYNKVMTHVNGMLHDSDMPSSASALYRHTKQKCMQMQIDKSNVSVGKRVTFGDDPLGMQKQHLATPTDTSLKMNQLAAKYLKHTPASHMHQSPKTMGDMSIATRNYMERHNLLQGPQQEIPRFLDITALKQQPKFI